MYQGPLFAPEAENRAVRAATVMAKPVEEVERLPFDLSALEDEGAFVNVDCSGFGCLDKKLDWTTFGVRIPKTTSVSFRAPTAGLLPDAYRLPLLRPVDQIREAHRTYSYKFSLTETVFQSPEYRWIPWRAFEAFEKDYAQAQSRLEAAIKEVEDNWPAIVQQVRSTFLNLAESSRKRLQATSADVPANFVEAVVSDLLGAMPTPTILRERLVLKYRVGVMMLGSEMYDEQKKAAQAKRDAAAAELAIGDELREADTKRREAELRVRSEQKRLSDEDRWRQEDRAREVEIKDRLKQMKIEAARERLDGAMNPIMEGAQQLHHAVWEAATAILKALEDNDSLPSASAKRAREVAKWFRLMNWQSDTELDDLLKELERLASRPPSRTKRDNTPVEDVLASIINRTYADARAFAESNRMSALEV